MVFSSSVFLFCFLPILLILYFNPLVKKRNTKNSILLLASLAFYFYGEPLFIFVMLISIAINWKIGLLIEKKPHNKKMLTIVATIYNILLLVAFKYTNFVTENIAILSRK